MKSLLPTIPFKLLEHNPTPSLLEMREFVHHFHAIQHAHDDHLASSIVQLTAAVGELTVQQSKLQASLEGNAATATIAESTG